MRLVEAIHRALTSAGMGTSGFSGHSFRIGAATTAAKMGLSDSMIMMLGQWQSAAFQEYIRTPRDHVIAVAPTLAGSISHG